MDVKLNLNIIFILVGLYIIALGIIYFLIFRKHHKRNKVEIDELIELVSKFFSLTTISLFIIGCGIYLFRNAAIHRYDNEEVRNSIILGIFIISATVLNYINYLKKSLKDFEEEVRQEKRKNDFKIGQIILLVLLIVFMLMPILRIPTFLKLKEFKEKLYFEIGKTVLLSISSIFLLYNLDPMGIKELIFRKKDKNKDKE